MSYRQSWMSIYVDWTIKVISQNMLQITERGKVINKQRHVSKWKYCKEKADNKNDIAQKLTDIFIKVLKDDILFILLQWM